MLLYSEFKVSHPPMKESVLIIDIDCDLFISPTVFILKFSFTLELFWKYHSSPIMLFKFVRFT